MIENDSRLSKWSFREGFFFPKACKCSVIRPRPRAELFFPSGITEPVKRNRAKQDDQKCFPRWRISQTKLKTLETIMKFCWMLLYNMIRYTCILHIYIYTYIDIEYIIVLFWSHIMDPDCMDMIQYIATEQHHISSCFTEKAGPTTEKHVPWHSRTVISQGFKVVSHWVSSPRKWHVLCPPESISPGNKTCIYLDETSLVSEVRSFKILLWFFPVHWCFQCNILTFPKDKQFKKTCASPSIVSIFA